MDARWRSAAALTRLEAGKRVPISAMGSLLRADDPVFAGNRIANTPDSGGLVAGLAAAGDRLRELFVHRRPAAAVRPSVLARLGGFPRVARGRGAAHRLVRQLADRDPRAQGFLPEPVERVSRLCRQR